MSSIPKVVAHFETTLGQKMSAAATSGLLTAILDKAGNTVSGYVGVTIDEGTPTEEEMVGTIDNTNNILTISLRGMDPQNPTNSIPALQFEHRRGASVKITDYPILGIVTMILSGQIAMSAPLFYDSTFTFSGKQLVTKEYVDGVAIAGVPNASLSTIGGSKLTANPNTTIGNPTISIASPAIVTLANHGLIAGDLIKFSTTGALPTGIVPSTTYYVIAAGLNTNTFEFSATSGGTAVNTSGSQSDTHTLVCTTPFAVSRDDGRLPTQNENDAMVGTSGTAVSSSNKFVDNSDTSNTPVAGKVARYDNNGNLAGVPTSTTYTAGESISLGQPVSINPADGKAYKASSAALDYRNLNYRGIALANATTGNPVVVQTSGLCTIPTLGNQQTTISEVVDAQQTDVTTGASSVAIDTTHNVGIPFRTGFKIGNLTKVDVRFAASSGSGGSGNITVGIYPITFDGAGAITLGTIVGSVTVATSSVTASAYNTFTFASPLTVSPNTYYAIVLSSTDTSGNNRNVLTAAPTGLNFASTGTGSTTSNLNQANLTQGTFAAFKTYYTVTQNYTLGDPIFLNDTQGSLTLGNYGTGNGDGTYKNPIGVIISATTIELGKSSGTQLIGSFGMPWTGTTSQNIAIPRPKAATHMKVVAVNTASGPSSFHSMFELKPDNGLANINVPGDSASSAPMKYQAGFDTILVNTNGNTSPNNAGTVIYFYK